MDYGEKRLCPYCKSNLVVKNGKRIIHVDTFCNGIRNRGKNIIFDCLDKAVKKEIPLLTYKCKVCGKSFYGDVEKSVSILGDNFFGTHNSIDKDNFIIDFKKHVMPGHEISSATEDYYIKLKNEIIRCYDECLDVSNKMAKFSVSPGTIRKYVKVWTDQLEQDSKKISDLNEVEITQVELCGSNCFVISDFNKFEIIAIAEAKDKNDFSALGEIMDEINSKKIKISRILISYNYLLLGFLQNKCPKSKIVLNPYDILTLVLGNYRHSFAKKFVNEAFFFKNVDYVIDCIMFDGASYKDGIDDRVSHIVNLIKADSNFTHAIKELYVFYNDINKENVQDILTNLSMIGFDGHNEWIRCMQNYSGENVKDTFLYYIQHQMAAFKKVYPKNYNYAKTYLLYKHKYK